MRTRISIATFASLALALLAVTAQAQYLTSTKAGFVNNVEGKVYVLRHDSEDGEKGRASLGTQMREGDTLSTAANSRAEVLLNPGSYLRLNENSEVHAISTSFDIVRFELVKGSASAEVGQIDKKSPIEIVTPNGSFFISKESLVRIDAKGASTLVSVRQGEVWLGTRDEAIAKKAAKIGRGKVANLTGSATPELAKVNKDQADEFDAWCFNRAQTLTAANVAALRRSGNVYSAFAGGWYYNPFYNCYTFIPFRGRYFSPYGFGFFNNWADCYWYDPYYRPYGYYGNGNNSGGGGGVVAGLPPRILSGNDRAPVRREPEGRGFDTGGGIMDSGRGGGRSIGDFGGSTSSAPSAPVVISAPAPSRGDSGGSSGGSMPSRPQNP
jgi:hypothetical protein